LVDLVRAADRQQDVPGGFANPSDFTPPLAGADSGAGADCQAGENVAGAPPVGPALHSFTSL